jgi:hypothetical protein
MRRRRRFGGVGAAVGDLASAVRRARDARATYVRTYDGPGVGRTLDPDSDAAKAAVEAANRLLESLSDSRKLDENGADRA